MIKDKMIVISEEEKETLHRVKRNYMRTELNEKYDFGCTVLDMWFDDEPIFEDFSINDGDWDIIDDILTDFEENGPNNMEMFDGAELLNMLANFNPWNDFELFHGYKVVMM